MKLKHYILLILTLLGIAFLQPLVLLLGGVTLLAGVMAFIFADLPPESQAAWEMKVAELLKQVRSALTKKPPEPVTLGSENQQSNGMPQAVGKTNRERNLLRLEGLSNNTGAITENGPVEGKGRSYRPK